MFRHMAAQLAATPQPFPWLGFRHLARLHPRRMRRAGKELCDREPLPFRPYWRDWREVVEWDLRPVHPRRHRRRSGSMELWELYEWHLARGTLWKLDWLLRPRW